MEPRKPSPAGHAYASGAKTARPAPVAPARPESGARTGGSSGVVLPLIASLSSSPRTGSPGGNLSKRVGWTTPRSPREVEPLRSGDGNAGIDFWNDGAPAATTDHTEEDEASQLAYMDQMYSKIQALTAELDREREENRKRAMNVEHQVELRERAALDVLQRYGTQSIEETENFSSVGVQIPLATSSDTGASTVNRKFRPHQPRSTSPPQPTRLLDRGKLELCSALGKNAELRIRTREIERHAEEASNALEQTQRQMKMAERRIANREEKLRALLKEKLHWQNEMKESREQVVEEKMRQVDLMRRLETTKRESTAQLDAMTQALRDSEEENQALRAHLAETKSLLAFQTKRLDEVMRQARDEKEKLTECIVEARTKFREWKDGEAAVIRAQREQALNNLKAEYELKITRHQDEKQKLREKVKDLEVSVRLMQKDRSLSPLELSLRKATILGSKDNAGTTEAELIEAHVRIKELEALLEHSQEFQKRQENIIKVSEAAISRLIQEREVAALDTMVNQQLPDGPTRVNSIHRSDPNTSLAEPLSSLGVTPLSPKQLAAPTRPHFKSPGSSGTAVKSPRAETRVSDQPFRPVAPPPRAASLTSPSRSVSKDPPLSASRSFLIPPSAREERLEVEIKRMEAALQEARSQQQQQNDARRKQDDQTEQLNETDDTKLIEDCANFSEVRHQSGTAADSEVLHDRSVEACLQDDSGMRSCDRGPNHGCEAEGTRSKESDKRDQEGVSDGSALEDRSEESSGSLDDTSHTTGKEGLSEETKTSSGDHINAETGEDSRSRDNFDVLRPESSAEKAIVKVLESDALSLAFESPIEGVHTSFDASTRGEAFVDSKENAKSDAEASTKSSNIDLHPTVTRDDVPNAPGLDLSRENHPENVADDVEGESKEGSDLADAITSDEQQKSFPESCTCENDFSRLETTDYVDHNVDDPHTPDLAVIDKDLSVEKDNAEENMKVPEVDALGECASQCTPDSREHTNNDSYQEAILSLVIRSIAQRVVEEVQDVVVNKMSSDVRSVKEDHGRRDCEDLLGHERLYDSPKLDMKLVRHHSCVEMVDEVVKRAVHSVQARVIASRAQVECEGVAVEVGEHEPRSEGSCNYVGCQMSEEITETTEVDSSPTDKSTDLMDQLSGSSCVSSDDLDYSTTLSRVMATALTVATSAQVIGIMKVESVSPTPEPFALDIVELECPQDIVVAHYACLKIPDTLPERSFDDLINTQELTESSGVHSSHSSQSLEHDYDPRVHIVEMQLQVDHVPQVDTLATMDANDSGTDEASKYDIIEAGPTIVDPSSELLLNSSQVSHEATEDPPTIAVSVIDSDCAPLELFDDPIMVDIGHDHELGVHNASVNEDFADEEGNDELNPALTESRIELSPDAIGSAEIAEVAMSFLVAAQDAAIERVVSARLIYRTVLQTHLKVQVEAIMEEGIAACIYHLSGSKSHANVSASAQDEISEVKDHQATDYSENTGRDSERNNSAKGDVAENYATDPVLLGDPVIEFETSKEVTLMDEQASLKDQDAHQDAVAPPSTTPPDLNHPLFTVSTACGMTAMNEEDECIPDILASIVQLVEKSIVVEPIPQSCDYPEEIVVVMDLLTREISSLETKVGADHLNDCAPKVTEPELDSMVRSANNLTDKAPSGDSKGDHVKQEIETTMMTMLKEIQPACDDQACLVSFASNLTDKAPLVDREGDHVEQEMETTMMAMLKEIQPAWDHQKSLPSSENDEIGTESRDVPGSSSIYEMIVHQGTSQDIEDTDPESRYNSVDLYTVEKSSSGCIHNKLLEQTTSGTVENCTNPWELDASASVDCETTLIFLQEDDINVVAREILTSAVEVVALVASLLENAVSGSQADDYCVANMVDHHYVTKLATSVDGLTENSTFEHDSQDAGTTQIMSLINEILSIIEHDHQVGFLNNQHATVVTPTDECDQNSICTTEVVELIQDEGGATDNLQVDHLEMAPDNDDVSSSDNDHKSSRILPIECETNEVDVTDDVKGKGNNSEVFHLHGDKPDEEKDDDGDIFRVSACEVSILGNGNWLSTALSENPLSAALETRVMNDRLQSTKSLPWVFPDSSRYASAVVREAIRDPTLLAYDVKHEQAQPFALLDEKILTIDPNARHMQYDENDKVRKPSDAPPSKTLTAIDGVLVTKRKRIEHEAHRKSIAYRIIPAFNYEPVLIKFQWSDFVVATPIRLMSSTSQLNLLNSLSDGKANASNPGEPAKQQITICPIQKMKLIMKKGVKLPCSTYVIISVFNRPLEDGNETLRIQIYDSERVEEYQYDFHEDHLREYVEMWNGTDDEARAFYARLEFRREQGTVIIKMPDKIRTATPDFGDTATSDDTTEPAPPRVFSPPPMAQLLSVLATTQPLELPPEPQYRLSPNAPASPPRQPPPLVHQTTAPHRLESSQFFRIAPSRIEEDIESLP